MPSSAILNFTDSYPYQSAIRAAHVEFLPTARGAFRAELTKIDLHRLWMQRFNENLPRIFYGAVSPQRAPIDFLTDFDQPACRHCGMEVSPGEIVVHDQNEFNRKSIAPCRWGAMSLTPEDLAAAGEALVGRPVMRPSATMVIRPSPPLMSRLLELHEIAAQLAKTAPDILTNPAVAQALESELTSAMIMCLTENTSVEGSASGQRHSLVMSRFEEFLASHETVPLYVTDICRAVGVSQRTLLAYCQESLGMGPVKYLWLRRMYLARRAFLDAPPDTSTVTGIAADHGFYEFGRFSVEYRARFGKSPSETLHRPK